MPRADELVVMTLFLKTTSPALRMPPPPGKSGASPFLMTNESMQRTACRRDAPVRAAVRASKDARPTFCAGCSSSISSWWTRSSANLPIRIDFECGGPGANKMTSSDRDAASVDGDDCRTALRWGLDILESR